MNPPARAAAPAAAAAAACLVVVLDFATGLDPGALVRRRRRTRSLAFLLRLLTALSGQAHSRGRWLFLGFLIPTTMRIREGREGLLLPLLLLLVIKTCCRPPSGRR